MVLVESSNLDLSPVAVCAFCRSERNTGLITTPPLTSQYDQWCPACMRKQGILEHSSAASLARRSTKPRLPTSAGSGRLPARSCLSRTPAAGVKQTIENGHKRGFNASSRATSVKVINIFFNRGNIWAIDRPRVNRPEICKTTKPCNEAQMRCA